MSWSRTLKLRHVRSCGVRRRVTLGSPYLCEGPAGLTALLLAAVSQRGPLQGPKLLLPGPVLLGHQPRHLGHLCLGLYSCTESQPSPQVRKVTRRFLHSCMNFLLFTQHSFIHTGNWIHTVQSSESDRPGLLDPSPPAYSASVSLAVKWGNNTHFMGHR